MSALDSLREIYSELLSLRKDISAEKCKRISKQGIRHRAESIATKWFSGISDILSVSSLVPSEMIQAYSDHFGRLLKISGPNNLKSSYMDTLAKLSRKFRDDLIIPIQKRPHSGTGSSLLSKILNGLPNPDENAYLKEAISCAGKEFYRAAVVLGWCAAIDKIHKTVEKIGCAKFNVTSASMASQVQGRFKKFNLPPNVASLSELREVFDTVVLWVIEGMQLIDSNQHTRLKGCFDLRCQCAHPGEAPVTEYNLLSFFSDLNEIVFRNTKFQTR
jgi:hypothetical protein